MEISEINRRIKYYENQTRRYQIENNIHMFSYYRNKVWEYKKKYEKAEHKFIAEFWKGK